MRKTVIITSLLFTLSIFLIPTIAMAGAKIPVCVVDSGSDFTHSLLKPVANANAKELKGKTGVDDDKNGYIDDPLGWNFVENNNTLVNLDNTPPAYDNKLRFMELMGKYQSVGQAGMTEEEFNFLRTNYQDKEFMGWVGFIGGWAHGSHCAGIVAQDNNAVKVNAIRHIPTGQAPNGDIEHMLAPLTLQLRMDNQEARAETIQAPPSLDEFEAYFKQQGQAMAEQAKAEAEYLGSLKPRVINCSFGTDNKNLLASFKKNMIESWGYGNPTDQQVQDLVNLFVTNAMLTRDKAFFKHVDNALIVIAAGNSTENNDGLVISPNNVDLPNTLIIAATNQDKAIANFSCFGVKTVDVAVPGVNIYSSYPNGKMGFMSGTSMAAPLASRYAAMILQANPALTPVQLKTIIMKTVDKKSWLKDKVKSGGVINVTRAIAAAKSMKDGVKMNQAILTAGTEVEDAIKANPFDLFEAPKFETEFEKALYNSAIF